MNSIKVKNPSPGIYEITLHGDDFIDLLELLKEVIPYHARIYDPARKIWKVSDEWYLNQWLGDCESRFHVRVEWATKNQESNRRAEPKPILSKRDQAFMTLHLQPTAPPEVIEAAWKALAAIHHPDRGGDLLTMQQINNARDILKKR